MKTNQIKTIYKQIIDMENYIQEFTDKNSKYFHKNYPFLTEDSYKPINYKFNNVKEAYEFLSARLNDDRKVEILF